MSIPVIQINRISFSITEWHCFLIRFSLTKLMDQWRKKKKWTNSSRSSTVSVPVPIDNWGVSFVNPNLTGNMNGNKMRHWRKVLSSTDRLRLIKSKDKETFSQVDRTKTQLNDLKRKQCVCFSLSFRVRVEIERRTKRQIFLIGLRKDSSLNHSSRMNNSEKWRQMRIFICSQRKRGRG